MLSPLRNILIAAICALAAALPAAAQGLTAAKCLAEAPAEVLPLLPKSTRLDMLDYYRAGSSKPSANSAGAPARVIDEKPACVTFLICDSIQAQIFVLKAQSSCPVIGLIETLPLPARDSRLRFFSCRWEPLDIQAEPSLRQWLRHPSSERLAAAERQLPFILAAYSYAPDRQELTATLTLPSYYTADDAPEALAWLRPSVTMRWNGKKFKTL